MCTFTKTSQYIEYVWCFRLTCPKWFHEKSRREAEAQEERDAAQSTVHVSDLERAAEASRAEHAEVVAELAEEILAHELTREAVKAAVDEWNAQSAALGLATARIRELEGERDRALDALRDEEKKTYAEKRETHAARLERDELLGLVKRAADMLAEVQEEPDGWQEWSAIVARIEKATKGTEQG